jgi:hypothetical protein
MTDAVTLQDAFRDALRQASSYNKADQTAPAAVLWTDKSRQWETIVPRLRAELPLLTLGDYDPSQRTGPAIWLRCMIARTLADADWPNNETPIVYLPGVSRQDLRAIADCPPSLKPLVELQYRGVLFTQKNARDWTIEAFLKSGDGGLQIDVSADTATREALPRTLLRLADEPLSALRAEAPLTSGKLNALLNPEPIRDLLIWMNSPKSQRAIKDAATWAAFQDYCWQQLEFDPEADGALTAAMLLGGRQGQWQSVWNRFAEAPAKYPALPALLRQARPVQADNLFFDSSTWPQDNENAEAELRTALAALKDSPSEPRREIAELEKLHAERRTWVWAELGQSPLARVLPSLVALADATQTPLSGVTPQEIASAYTAGGWRADIAVLDALAGVEAAVDVAAVKHALNILYQPWLRATAEAFQAAVRKHPLPKQKPADPTPKMGVCTLFADGLRYDIAERVAAALEEKGQTVKRDWQFTALPGVTPTAKPAVSPVAALLGPGSGFDATVVSDGAKVTADVLRREMVSQGYTILGRDDTGKPSGAAWSETGHLDEYGHNQGWRLALRVAEEVKAIAERVLTLLDSGWQEIRIVTDHGWLLLPGGLPKAELPEHLTEARKGRCARLKPNSQTDQQIVPWRWDEDVRIAVAPGISCYVAGREYEHGGLSPQECVTPVLTVRAGAPQQPLPMLDEPVWRGLRCRVQVLDPIPGLTVDLRTKAADANTSLASIPKPVDDKGQAALVVEDDERLGDSVHLVLLDAHGSVISKRNTTVGE